MNKEDYRLKIVNCAENHKNTLDSMILKTEKGYVCVDCVVEKSLINDSLSDSSKPVHPKAGENAVFSTPESRGKPAFGFLNKIRGLTG